MDLLPIILASASPRRRELIRQLGVEADPIPADTTELRNEHLTGRELALLNAYRKARVVAKRFPDRIVLGADTLVCLDSLLLGKPNDLEEAHEMLSRLSGKTHQVVTGVCLLRLRRHEEKLFAETTDVSFRSLTPSAIAKYLSVVDPLDKAGAYAIQESGGEVVADISGSYSNVVGLPMEALRAELANWRS